MEKKRKGKKMEKKEDVQKSHLSVSKAKGIRVAFEKH